MGLADYFTGGTIGKRAKANDEAVALLESSARKQKRTKQKTQAKTVAKKEPVKNEVNYVPAHKRKSLAGGV